jgi:hypothetical protein
MTPARYLQLRRTELIRPEPICAEAQCGAKCCDDRLGALRLLRMSEGVGGLMLSSSVQRFAEPSAFTEAVRHASVQLTVTSRGDYSAQFTSINLHRLWLRRFSDNLPRVTRTDSPAGRMNLAFRTETGQRASWNGADLQPTNVTRHRESESSTLYTSGALGYAAMSLPEDDVASISVAAGCDLAPPRDTRSTACRARNRHSSSASPCR